MADLKTKFMTYDTVDHEICESLGCYKQTYQSFTIPPPLLQQTTKSYLAYQKLCESLSKLAVRNLNPKRYRRYDTEFDDDFEEEEQLRADRDGKLSGLVSFRKKGIHNPFGYGGCGYSGLLSPDVDEIVGKMWSDGGLFILVIEDVDIFDCLVAASFHRRFRCIMISSGIRNAQPDNTSRWYLKKMHEDLKLPVLALVPCSPRGLTFLAIHRWGLSSDEYDFTIPDIKWFGFRPSDSGKFDVPDLVVTIEMTDEELNLANDLLDTFSKDPSWLEELQLMIKNGIYPRLSMSGNLLDYYLPCKLHKRDWVPHVEDTEQPRVEPATIPGVVGQAL